MNQKFPYLKSASQTHTLSQRMKKLKKEINTLAIESDTKKRENLKKPTKIMKKSKKKNY